MSGASPSRGLTTGLATLLLLVLLLPPRAQANASREGFTAGLSFGFVLFTKPATNYQCSGEWLLYLGSPKLELADCSGTISVESGATELDFGFGGTLRLGYFLNPDLAVVADLIYALGDSGAGDGSAGTLVYLGPAAEYWFADMFFGRFGAGFAGWSFEPDSGPGLGVEISFGLAGEVGDGHALGLVLTHLPVFFRDPYSSTTHIVLEWQIW